MIGFRSVFAVIAAAVAFAPLAHGGVSYFLVAEKPGQAIHGDSFVIPLSDSQQIQHARDLISKGPDKAGSPIVFADIAKGSGGGVNRDLLSSDRHEWSWHVTNVSGFGDFGIEQIDGWPTYVDKHRDNWLDETGGHIGFWSYTVVKELPSYNPANPTAVPLPPAAWAGALTLGGLFLTRFARARRE